MSRKKRDTKRYFLYRYILAFGYLLLEIGYNNIYTSDFYINFDNPQEIPYLWKKVTTSPYSSWTSSGFDKNKGMFWIKYYKKPVAYMFYKLIKIDSRNFYRLRLGYHTAYETYFCVYLKYIGKNFKQMGYQILYKDKLNPKKKHIEIEFKPTKKAKKAIIYISVVYVKYISKLYIKYISLNSINKLYSNLDNLYIIPYRRNYNLRVCYRVPNIYNSILKISFLNIWNKRTKLFVKRIHKAKGCIKMYLNLSSGIYRFKYFLSSGNNLFYKKAQILWVTSYLSYLKKHIYVYNTSHKLFLNTIPVVSFLNFNKKSSHSIILEPFLPDNIFSTYYPTDPTTFFRSSFSLILINYMKKSYNLKSLFLILKESNSTFTKTIPQYPKSLNTLIKVFFIKEKDLKKDIGRSLNTAGEENFVLINKNGIDNIHNVSGKKIIVNYENLKKLIPMIFLMILTRYSTHFNELYFSEEYKFFINKDKTITIIKHSKEPIDISVLPIEQVLINTSLDLRLFGYKTNKKIYILKFRGELPSSKEKTINSLSIFPRSFFAPLNSIKSHISLENHFNNNIEIKHITIETGRKWEISIQGKPDKIESKHKTNIPFVINLPPFTPLKRYIFLLKLKLFHSKIGEMEVKKLFSISIKSREFSAKNKIRKENDGIAIFLTLKNKKSKTSAYYIVVVQPPQLLKQEISLKLLPKKKETTYIKLNTYKKGNPIILSIKNALTRNIFFLEITPKY